MPKHTEKVAVYDHRASTNRGVTLEITAPQFLLDCLEEGKFDAQLVAQEAFDTPGRKLVIEVAVRLPKR